MVGTPGGSRPRTRRSARSAAAAAAASPAPLLEPAGPVTPDGGSDQATPGAADCMERGHPANKRPRTEPVRIFTGDSIDTAVS